MTRNEENLCQFFKYVLIQRLNNIFLKNNPLFPNISTYAQLLEENIIKKKKSHQECIKFHIVKTYKRFVIWGGGGVNYYTLIKQKQNTLYSWKYN